jgi:hypothetical protein
MTLINPKQLRQLEVKKRRGWILCLLQASLPKPLDFASLITLLDERNFPMSARKFSEDLDFLRSSGMLRVFPLGHESELNNVAQAKLLQRYADSEGELDDDFCALLTTNGVHFQEGETDVIGVTRVN